MRIDSIRALNGANIYSHHPVLLMDLDLEGLKDKESRDFSGFNERLIDLLPGIETHHCSKGRPGGFVERLNEGTFFGHIVEHVVLELTDLAGVGTFHGKTRQGHEPGSYNIAVEYKAEHGTRFLCHVAVELVETLLRGEEYPLDQKLDEARRIVASTELGPSTRAIVDAASARGIPWFRIGDASLVQLGYGINRRHIQAAISDSTRAVAVEIAGDKELTKNFLEQASIPVPQGQVVTTVEEAFKALQDMGGPVVVKPLYGHQGKGVSINLATRDQVASAVEIARAYSREVIVEELYTGRNYRVLVINGKMVAASERLPAHVIGDGTRNVSELIEIANADPRRGEDHEKPLTKIVVDSVVQQYLAKTARALNDVPAQGEMIILREGVNLSTGGIARDVTDDVHPSVERLCVRVARTMGMDICGVDLMMEDISRPFTKENGAVIEVNASPGLRMHLSPNEGRPRDVGGAIVDMLYPNGASARIPIISITGTNGKTTVTRMISHMIGQTGRNVGMTTTDGICIGGELVAEGDTTGPHSAHVVLSDPSVEVAVLETARGGLARRGLGYDWSDVSVMTNITGDHIGQDGIRNTDDIVYIKSLVAERVREGGVLILNADDEHLSRLMEIPRVSRLRRQIVYFSMHENSLLVKKHRASGGTAFFVKNGWIFEARNFRESKVVRVESIPVTLGGLAEFNVANSLAAIAAAREYGLTREQVAGGIMSFRSVEHNAGRANLFQVNGGYVMLDYGHNSDAFAAVCRTASQWKDRKVTGVIGVPGDRADSVIKEAGRAASNGFHRIVIKEDTDTRGRQRGEVASILLEAVKEAAPERECVTILDDLQAIRGELERIGERDILVVFYDKLTAVLEVLDQAGAIPVSTIARLAARASAGRA